MRRFFALGSLGVIAMVASFFALSTPLNAQSPPQIPNFMPYVDTGWMATSNDYYPPARGPRPVTFDPAHPMSRTDGCSSRHFGVLAVFYKPARALSRLNALRIMYGHSPR